MKIHAIPFLFFTPLIVAIIMLLGGVGKGHTSTKYTVNPNDPPSQTDTPSK